MVAFLTLLFFIVLVDSIDGLSHDTFIQKFAVALSAYLFFILFCKTEGHITVVLLCVMFIAYLTNTYNRTLKQERDSLHKNGLNSTKSSRIRLEYLHQTLLPRIQIIENCLHTVIIVLVLIGVVAYIGKQSKKRQRWLWSKFFFGNEKKCNFRRRFKFDNFTFTELSKELKLGVSKIVRG